MAVLDIACANWLKFKVTSPDWVPVDNSTILLLRKSVLALHAAVPVEKLIVEAETLPFTYEIKLVDGRKWAQTFSARITDPGMTFTVTDEWKLSEFAQQRTIRDAVLLGLVELGITHIEARPRV